MKTLLICRSSRPQVSYKVGVLKNFAKFTKISAPEFFNEVEDGGLKPTILLKRDSGTDGNLQNFEECLFYRTAVDDCFWIYQNINCQKVSISELIISKSYNVYIRHFDFQRRSKKLCRLRMKTRE